MITMVVRHARLATMRGEQSQPLDGPLALIEDGAIAVEGDKLAYVGSDAIADWPVLNALINTAAGATWVSVHHGGGVGIGNAIHAGMVVVADGTDAQTERLERVLTTDPGTGVMRHADAGYDEAIDAAREHGLDLPSLQD